MIRQITRSLVTMTALLLWMTPATAQVASTAGTSRIDRSVAQKIVRELNRGARVAVVGFQTQFGEAVSTTPGSKERIKVAKTGVVHIAHDGRLRAHFRVRGTFSLLEGPANSPPDLGVIDAMLPLRHSEEQDELYARLAPLLTAESAPVFLLVFPGNARSVLEGLFVGPLSASDVQFIRDLKVQVTDAGGYANLNEQAAEKLLQTKNPWATYLSWTILEGKKMLSARHIAQGMNGIADPYLKAMLDDAFMLSHLQVSIKKDLANALCGALAQRSNADVIQFATDISDFLKRQPALVGQSLDLAAFKQGLLKVRQQLRDRPKAENALRAVDELIVAVDKYSRSQ